MSKITLLDWCKQNGDYGEKIIKEYSTKNTIDISQVSYGNSTIKLLWNCLKCHGEYYSKANSRTSDDRRGCPYCSGRKILKGYNDLYTLFPSLCCEWSYDKNKKKPNEYTKGSNQKVWWHCKKCNSDYYMSILSRTSSQKQGCPYCSSKKVKVGYNDLESKFPIIASEFDISKNKISPDKVFSKSSKYYYWICSTCGNSYYMQVNTRTNGHQCCPKCANRFQTSFPEQAILYYLLKNNIKAVSREKIDGYELDIFIPNQMIGIEYDGMFYHTNKKNKEYQKNKVMKNNNIFLIRIKESDRKKIKIYKNLMIIEYKYVNSSYKNLSEVILFILNYINNSNKIYKINLTEDIQDILSYKNVSIRNNLLEKMPTIANEWNYSKNSTKPEYHTYKSNDLVWWKCKKCGHSWKSTIANRVEHDNGCPKCSKIAKAIKYRKTISKKTSNIISKYPSIEENISARNSIDKSLLNVGSADFIYWICSCCKKEFNNHQIRTMIKKYCKYGDIYCDECIKTNLFK